MNILRYDWRLLRKKTNDDIDKINDYFANIYVLKNVASEFIIDNPWASEVEKSDTKDSFMLNVESYIRNDMKATKLEQFVYLDLLSRRNAFSYYNTRGKAVYLPAWKVENMYDIEKLKANRLLEIEGNNIYFVYEQEIAEWV